MIDHEVYDLTQTGQQVQNILDKGEALPTNQQIQQYLAAKQDKLTFDNVPVRGSDNPITSGAVYDATTEEYEGPVTELPQAGADTMHKIYLVGEEGATTYDRYYTSFDGTNYSWVPMGSTQINLSGKADKLGSGHTDKVATFNNNGNLKDSGIAVADVESSIVYDISRANAVGDVLTTYADLAAALGTNGANVPQSLRRGGMSVKYVQSVDNKYVQFRYMGTSTADTGFTNTANWQGVDTEIKRNSQNLIESGSVYPLQTKVIGERMSDTYAVSGYNQQRGSYNFKKDVQYDFTINCASQATLYLAIKDSGGTTIRASAAYSTFPATFSWTPSANYDGAYLNLSCGSSISCTIDITTKGLEDDVVTLKAGLSGFLQSSFVKSCILSESFTVTSLTRINGDISSAEIVYPDKVTGTLTITRNSTGDITQEVATYGTDSYTLSITRDSNGDVTSTIIVKNQ